jgi:hypothetical protein
MAYARIPVREVYAEHKRPAFAKEIVAGVGAGQVAGLVMVVALMAVFSVFLRKSAFYPVEVIAASVLGEHVIGHLDARTLLVGALVHQLGPSLFWGLVFGIVVWVVKPRRSMALMMFGLLVGAIAQVVDVNLVLPLLSGAWSGSLPILEPLQRANLWAAHVPPAASWLAHLVFGVALSVYPWKYDALVGGFD